MHALFDILKKQVYADDFTTDDDYLDALLTSAEASVRCRLGVTEANEAEVMGDPTKPDIAHAIVLIAAHWYHFREPVTSGNAAAVPYTLDYLLRPHTRLGWLPEN